MSGITSIRALGYIDGDMYLGRFSLVTKVNYVDGVLSGNDSTVTGFPNNIRGMHVEDYQVFVLRTNGRINRLDIDPSNHFLLSNDTALTVVNPHNRSRSILLIGNKILLGDNNGVIHDYDYSSITNSVNNRRSITLPDGYSNIGGITKFNGRVCIMNNGDSMIVSFEYDPVNGTLTNPMEEVAVGGLIHAMTATRDELLWIENGSDDVHGSKYGGIIDSLSRMTTRIVPLNESISVNDTVGTEGEQSADLAEDIDVTDSVASGATLSRENVESVIGSDEVSYSHGKNLEEPITATDLVEKAGASEVDLAEDIDVSDRIVSGMRRTLPESETVSDTLGKSSTATRNLSESVTISDNAELEGETNLIEDIDVSDMVSKSKTNERKLIEIPWDILSTTVGAPNARNRAITLVGNDLNVHSGTMIYRNEYLGVNTDSTAWVQRITETQVRSMTSSGDTLIICTRNGTISRLEGRNDTKIGITAADVNTNNIHEILYVDGKLLMYDRTERKIYDLDLDLANNTGANYRELTGDYITDIYAMSWFRGRVYLPEYTTGIIRSYKYDPINGTLSDEMVILDTGLSNIHGMVTADNMIVIARSNSDQLNFMEYADIIDSISIERSHNRNQTESIPSTDAVDRSGDNVKTLAESIPSTDALDLSGDNTRNLAESIPSTDSVSTSKTLRRVLSEAISVIDDVIRQASGELVVGLKSNRVISGSVKTVRIISGVLKTNNKVDVS